MSRALHGVEEGRAGARPLARRFAGGGALLAGAILAGTLLVQPRVAFAQPEPPPLPASASPGAAAPLSETLRGDLLRDYQAGRLLLLYHDPVGALLRFQRVYDAVRDPRVLANVALAEKDLGHFARASTLFRRALSEGAALFAPEQLAQLRGLLDTCLAKATRAQVVVDVPGAAVTVDDQPAGTSPLVTDVLVDPGVHRVQVTKAGYRPFTRDVDVRGAGVVPIEVKLSLEAPEGIVRVVTAPGNEVSIDGQPLPGATREKRVSVGTHALAVSAPGMDTFRSDVTVKDGETREVNVKLEASRGAPVWVWVTGGIVAGVAIVVAGASVLHSSETKGASATSSVASPLRLSW